MTTSRSRSPSEYVESSDHLPARFRDFHDQKDLFKLIDDSIDWDAREQRHGVADRLPWTAAQVYVIDIFLWWMAKRGWTLQRSRARVEFHDLDEELASKRDRDVDSLRSLLEGSR